MKATDLSICLRFVNYTKKIMQELDEGKNVHFTELFRAHEAHCLIALLDKNGATNIHLLYTENLIHGGESTNNIHIW